MFIMEMCCDVTSYINSGIIVSQRERIKLCHKQFAVQYHQGLKNRVADTDGVCFSFICLKELLFVGTFQVFPLFS
jgi:hypothetical protein